MSSFIKVDPVTRCPVCVLIVKTSLLSFLLHLLTSRGQHVDDRLTVFLTGCFVFCMLGGVLFNTSVKSF